MKNEFFKEWFEIQKHYIEELEVVFGNIPVTKIPWYDMDINGLGTLEKIAEDALNAEDIFGIRNIVLNEIYEKTDNGYLLKVFLPCLDKQDLNLHQSGTDVIIKIGNFKRNIPIPSSLRQYYISSAKIDNQILNIRFEKEEVDNDK